MRGHGSNNREITEKKDPSAYKLVCRQNKKVSRKSKKSVKTPKQSAGVMV